MKLFRQTEVGFYIPGNFIPASLRAKLAFPICLNILRICAYWRSRLFTSCTLVPDPLAIQIGSVLSTGLQGPVVSMGMAITSPTSFYQLISGGVDTAPNTP